MTVSIYSIYIGYNVENNAVKYGLENVQSGLEI